MLLALMRHGAYNDSLTTLKDSDRTLTPIGKEETAFVGNVLRQKEMKPSKIISSPLTRALQTAQIMAEALEYDGKIEVAQEIVPSASIQEMYETVLRHAELAQLLIVGHMPSMGALANVLIESPERISTAMEKSEVLGIGLRLESERLRGPLLWRVNAQ